MTQCQSNDFVDFSSQVHPLRMCKPFEGINLINQYVLSANIYQGSFLSNGYIIMCIYMFGTVYTCMYRYSCNQDGLILL